MGNETWYSHIAECYSVLQRNEEVIPAIIGMNLENTMLR
jgi:hypothetical protein